MAQRPIPQATEAGLRSPGHRAGAWFPAVPARRAPLEQSRPPGQRPFPLPAGGPGQRAVSRPAAAALAKGTAARWIAAAIALLAALSLSFAAIACSRAPAPAAGELRLVDTGADGLLSAVRESGGRAVLVNVWATWCRPCREEMPDLVRLERELSPRGFRLLLVCADFPDERAAAEVFLRKQGVDFTTFFKTGEDMAFIDGLDEKWSGALPASFLYDGKGRLLDSWIGKRDYATLEKKVLDALG
jgi:thiol-disulfide isomerase/thioredoxin